MPYVDDTTWEALQLIISRNNERIARLEQRIQQLEERQPISPRDSEFWPVMLEEFAGSEIGVDFDEKNAFSTFVRFINTEYPECIDLVFEIWDSR